MNPISFTIIKGITHFHYNRDKLVDFVRRGKKDGNVGTILTKREGNILTYRGFGTIEKPFTHIATISAVHFPLFDGEMPTDESRIENAPIYFNNCTISFEIVDFSRTDYSINY